MEDCRSRVLQLPIEATRFNRRVDVFDLMPVLRRHGMPVGGFRGRRFFPQHRTGEFCLGGGVEVLLKRMAVLLSAGWLDPVRGETLSVMSNSSAQFGDSSRSIHSCSLKRGW